MSKFEVPAPPPPCPGSSLSSPPVLRLGAELRLTAVLVGQRFASVCRRRRRRILPARDIGFLRGRGGGDASSAAGLGWNPLCPLLSLGALGVLGREWGSSVRGRLGLRRPADGSGARVPGRLIRAIAILLVWPLLARFLGTRHLERARVSPISAVYTGSGKVRLGTHVLWLAAIRDWIPV